VDVRWDERGLVPTVVVDAATGGVLMVAYMNAESLRLTQETGETWFWSRSRGELWHKGATSGNTQEVVSVALDCDGDTLLVRVRPRGPACHTGTQTCFDGADGGPSGGILPVLDAVLEQRNRERPEGSHTTRLLDDDNLRIKKLGEESAELIHALVGGSEQRAVEEAADLIYHVAVALKARGRTLSDVQQELLRRHG
jgi:phosphoribosyl-ATP pyrophosphohydrolase/phosphoribosyl-AMP cyclohydrolase